MAMTSAQRDGPDETSPEKIKSNHAKVESASTSVEAPINREPHVEEVAVVDYLIEADQVSYFFINVVQQPSGDRWSVKKRFSKIEQFLADFQEQFPQKSFPSLPPKKFKSFKGNFTPSFQEDRRCLMDNFFRKLLKMSEISRAPSLASFLRQDRIPGRSTRISPLDIDPDDFPLEQEVTHISIPSTRLMSDHVLYQVHISNCRKRNSFQRWTQLKRYGQFYNLDSKLRHQYMETPLLLDMPQLPQRKYKMFQDHMNDVFIEQRRALLENYLLRLLMMPEIACNTIFLDFCGVDL
eukprot:159449_1